MSAGEASKPSAEIAGWGMSSVDEPLDSDLRDICEHIDAELARARDVLSKAPTAPALDNLLDRFGEIESWATAACQELERRGAVASGPSDE